MTWKDVVTGKNPREQDRFVAAFREFADAAGEQIARDRERFLASLEEEPEEEPVDLNDLPVEAGGVDLDAEFPTEEEE